MNKRGMVALISVFSLLFGLLPAVISPVSAKAATSSDFNPGNIISDAIFFDGSSMDANSVQNFLNSKVTACRSGYTCLKSFSQATPNLASDSYCNSYNGSGSESAASIIANVGRACNISPKVLLVLLEKEQSLISDTWPVDYQYRNATGFGCPDTAPCDPNYYGFFYQVYYAARQFQKYAATPGSWNYKAGQNNTIRYNPNVACGSSTVFIQNQATAGLYIYTPYQPNSAALSNLYGTGDSCSAYGNRNFWRIFTDWFGSTIASPLIRTVQDSTVYLVSGGKKFPIPSMELLNVYSVLGQVSYVSQSYINSLSTAQNVSRVIRGSDGSIYFVDSGIKLPFGSCNQVVDFGGSCTTTGYIQLDDAQVAAFRTGPSIGSVIGAPSGTRFVVQAGTKKEILDSVSLAQSGLATGNYNVLGESALNYLPFGAPITRDSVFVKVSQTSDYALIMNGQQTPIPSSVASTTGISNKSVGALSQQSMNLIPSSGQTFSGSLLVSGTTSPISVIADGSRYEIQAGAATVSGALGVTPAVLALFPAKGNISQGTLLKSPDNGSIYIVMPSDIRPISSWDTLLFISDNPSWLTVPSSVLNSFKWGPVALKGGNLYRSPDDATVFLINGLRNKIPFAKFDFPFEAGFNEFSFTSQERVDAYPYSGSLLTYGLKCSNNYYVTAGGSAHLVVAGQENLFPFQFVELDSFMCNRLKVGASATKFIRTPEGSIYYLSGGQKLPVGSMARYLQLGPDSNGYMNVSNRFADMIPTGPAA